MTLVRALPISANGGVNKRHDIVRVCREREDLSCTHACNVQVKLKNTPPMLDVSWRPELAADDGERLKFFDAVALFLRPQFLELRHCFLHQRFPCAGTFCDSGPNVKFRTRNMYAISPDSDAKAPGHDERAGALA